MDAKEIRALTVFTESYLPLYKRWVETLPMGFVPFARRFDEEEHPWYDVNIFKLQSFIDILEDIDDGEIVMCSGSDVMFIKRGRELADAALKRMAEGGDREIDLWVTPNDDGLLDGLYFVRNSEKARAFLCKQAEALLLRLPSDKDIMQRVMRIDYIPRELFLFEDDVYNPAALFHHPAGKSSLEQKIKQQDRALKGLQAAKA